MSRHDEHRRTDNPFMLRERDLAIRWKMSRRSLQRMRREHRGPPWIMIMGSVRYALEDILSYEQRMKRGGE
ncbi:hypothetical protein N8I71_16770 [Roseibacterium sp. SDUM158016]|uniref:hypothetical protein n=1 Tax=Roseicyclus sediminis TaxID=2980997 RepID=UPI0021CFD642|nr:hypothetical protein [Roseibacterium sp. SDUM158016]MCU4654495.1 hypothetical protein [Roseibacterium sp. SDUM158016]